MRALAGSALPAQCRHTPARTRSFVQHLPAAAARVRRAPLQAARRGAPLCRIASSPGPSSDSLDEQPTGVVGLERRINEAVVSSTVFLFDTLYTERPYARFYVLETIARVPYFSFLSVLHLYETLGWWRRSDYLKVHFSESWNELHHLLIMESLGGNTRWADRFVAQHTAFAYFWVTCGLYLASPRMAYNLMEQIEEHAFQTYDEFLSTHGEELKQQPVPGVAAAYYNAADAYLFDEFQTGAQPGTRRPELQNLYDVFVAIRDDEGQHVSTMQNCQRGGGAMHSPHVAASTGGELPASDSAEVCAGVVDCAVSNPTGWPSGGGKQ